MEANPLKIGILHQLLVGFISAGRCGIRQKVYFPSGYVPLDPGDHMLSNKLLVDDSIDTFAGKNICYCPLLIPLASLLSASWPSYQVQAII
jgi:hypothetical protein